MSLCAFQLGRIRDNGELTMAVSLVTLHGQKFGTASGYIRELKNNFEKIARLNHANNTQKCRQNNVLNIVRDIIKSRQF